MLRHDRRSSAASAIWKSSSGDLADLSDTDDAETRDEVVREYNRVAEKHGIRTITPDDHNPSLPGQPPQQRGWFSRTFLRQVSTTSNTSSAKSDKKMKKRSVSDLALHLVNGAKEDNLRGKDLQTLIRLCGKSKLHLPLEYAPGVLVLPTCFRATAHYLAQHGPETRGIFRIPGSVRAVNALYRYYSADGEDSDEISSTICSPNLPSHMGAGPHEVASIFKRLLSCLPGGILGSLSLFEILVAVHDQLGGEAGFLRLSQTKIRARLIALAIGTVKSQLRRDLIYAVFGLLCLIGRTAEEAPRKDELGRPLPVTDLMGYSALGIVFGPLLVGDLLNSSSMTAASSASGSTSRHSPPPNTKPESRKEKVTEGYSSSISMIDKINAANSITEMLITHWREVVRHTNNLGLPGPSRDGSRQRIALWSSASDGFALTLPRRASRSMNPGGLWASPGPNPDIMRISKENSQPSIVLPRRRPRSMRPFSRTLAEVEASLLSPPAEEPSPGGLDIPKHPHDSARQPRKDFRDRHQSMEESRSNSHGRASYPSTPKGEPVTLKIAKFSDNVTIPGSRAHGFQLAGAKSTCLSIPVPGASHTTSPAFLTRWQRAEQRLRTASKGANPFKRRLSKNNAGSSSHSQFEGRPQSQRSQTSRASSNSPRGSVNVPPGGETLQIDGNNMDVFERERSRLAAWGSRRTSLASTSTGSPMLHSPGPQDARREGEQSDAPRKQLLNSSDVTRSRLSLSEFRRDPGQRPGVCLKNFSNDTTAGTLPFGRHSVTRHSSSEAAIGRPTHTATFTDRSLPRQAIPDNTVEQESAMTGARPCLIRQRTIKEEKATRIAPLGPRPEPPRLVLGSISSQRPAKSTGGTVKEMAAIFDNGFGQEPHHSSPAEETSRCSFKLRGVLSPYTVNSSPLNTSSRAHRARGQLSTDGEFWAPTVGDRRSRGFKIGARRETEDEANVPSARGFLSPDEANVLTAPERPLQAAHELLRDSELSLSSVIPNESSLERTAASPGSQQINREPDSPLALTDEPSKASTTPRFFLLSTPKRQKQQEETASKTGAPARDTADLDSRADSDGLTPNRDTHRGLQDERDHRGQREAGADNYELARLKRQLTRVERECARWRMRAERAEEKARFLERGLDAGLSVSESRATVDHSKHGFLAVDCEKGEGTL